MKIIVDQMPKNKNTCLFYGMCWNNDDYADNGGYFKTGCQLDEWYTCSLENGKCQHLKTCKFA